jgi:hypothetical protein
VAVEHVHDAAEVEQRPGQPVDFIDHYAVHCTCGDVGQQQLQGGPVHVRAGEAAVIVELRNGHPAFMALALDERRGGFALRIEGVEVLLQSFLG